MLHCRRSLFGLGLTAMVSFLGPVQGQSQLDWQPTFGAVSDLGLGGNNEVYDMALYDDGTGPALYIAGRFDHDNVNPDGSPSGGPNGNIAKWDGTHFVTLGEGVGVDAPSFAGLDPSSLPPDGPINALAVFDAGDGRGPGLYVAGRFSSAGGEAAENVARWDAGGWSAVGAGLPGPTLTDLEVVDFGGGPELFASRTNVIFSTTQAVARWTPEGWEYLPGGGWGRVSDLQAFEGPDGPRLVAAGVYLFLPGVTHSHPHLAQWDGSSWSDVGAAIDTSGAPVLHRVPGTETDALLSGGMGNELFAFDGVDWSAGMDLDGFNAVSMTEMETASGTETLVLLREGATQHFELGRWDGSGIELLEEYGSQERVRRIRALDWEGTGEPELLMGGRFDLVQTSAGPELLSGIARWTEFGGEPLAPAFPGEVAFAPVLFDDGSGHGPELYVLSDEYVLDGGQYVLAQFRLVRWRGGIWDVVAHIDSFVHCMEVLDVVPGGGEELVLAGSFSAIDGSPISNLAAFDGQSWTGIGGGVGGGWIYDMLLFEDGDQFTEPTLVIGGTFETAGGEPHPNVAYWTGTKWGHFGTDTPWFALFGEAVRALAVYDRGDGPELYAGGRFTSIGSNVVFHIARWSGEAWRDVGTPDSNGLTGDGVHDLLVHDFGFGEQLIVMGDFAWAGNEVPGTANIARTNGYTWAAVEGGLPGEAYEGLVFDDGVNGPRLTVSHNLAFSLSEGHGISSLDAGGWTTLELGATHNFLSRRGLLDMGTGELPVDGLVVAGLEFDLPSADNHVARWGHPVAALEERLGCQVGAPRLTPGVGLLAPGGSFPVFVAEAKSPLASLSLYVGSELLGECGVPLPGIGELLLELAPFPVLLTSGAIEVGHGSVHVDVPAEPSLAGQAAALQGLLVDLSGLGPAAELTTGLVGTL